MLPRLLLLYFAGEVTSYQRCDCLRSLSNHNPMPSHNTSPAAGHMTTAPFLGPLSHHAHPADALRQTCHIPLHLEPPPPQQEVLLSPLAAFPLQSALPPSHPQAMHPPDNLLLTPPLLPQLEAKSPFISSSCVVATFTFRCPPCDCCKVKFQWREEEGRRGGRKTFP